MNIALQPPALSPSVSSVSNTLFTDVQHDAGVTNGTHRALSPVWQRRLITHRLRAAVVENYSRGMSSQRMAAALGLGRTTVLEILKDSAVTVRPTDGSTRTPRPAVAARSDTQPTAIPREPRGA